MCCPAVRLVTVQAERLAGYGKTGRVVEMI
jgi:hypothetical protein